MTFLRFTSRGLFSQTIRAGALMMLAAACLGFGNLAAAGEQHPLAGADESTPSRYYGSTDIVKWNNLTER